MRRSNRLLVLACPILLAGGCRDSVEPTAPDAGRALADVSANALNDPVLFYSTYLGGGSPDFGRGIAVDAAGNAYVTGHTSSLNFPTTAGAFQTGGQGGQDAFVTKLNPTGSGLVYSTYLGGSDEDFAVGIAMDAVGSAYVTGGTKSTDFPTTAGAFQTTNAGGSPTSCCGSGHDAFVTKLDPAGGLGYSTYLGGNAVDDGLAIAIDAAGNAYVAGHTVTLSLPNTFPTTPGAFQTTTGGFGCSGFENAFVTKLNSTGTALVYSTLLGSEDAGLGIAVDALASAYVTGFTISPSFPVTPGAFKTSTNNTGACGGPQDAFVTKLNPFGTGLVYSTYLGGSGVDQGAGIALDALGDAYVTGGTGSGDFPTLVAFQPAFGGTRDAFVTKLNPFGTGLLYSTYLGGSGDDFGQGVAVDALGSAHVSGGTSSTNFPITTGVPQTTLGGSYDAFVTKLNPTGAGLVYSTYLGGSGDDFGQGIALDALPNPNAYVAGFTSSTNFPTTPGSFQTTFGGGSNDAFVTKIANIVLPPPPTVGKVTGGGSINVNVTGGIGTFGFIVQAQTTTGPVSGDLQYVNHASGANVHSLTFTTLVIAGNTATFSGTCTKNGALCTFAVDVTDNGEPGKTDQFTISISGGTPEGGTLQSGNILIHKTQ